MPQTEGLGHASMGTAAGPAGFRSPPDPGRPLFGLTVLLVEDSRFASEALRLICLRSGARIRRADSLAHARRHLSVYRPGAVVIDIGLPDGDGAELIAELHRARPRIDCILGTSGDPDRRAAALAAGADGFLPKPLISVAAAQAALLRHPVPQAREAGRPPADPLALRDDLTAAARRLDQPLDPADEARLAQFLCSLAASADDRSLRQAAERLRGAQKAPSGLGLRREARAALARVLRNRIAAAAPI